MSSFPAIMTSTYPRVHYSESKTSHPLKWIFLSNSRLTLSQILKRNGYKTAAFHSNPWVSAFFKYNKGFDEFYDKTENSSLKNELFKDVSFLNKISDYFRLAKGSLKIIFGKKGNTDRANIINTKAFEWLQNNYDGFFLWVHYMDVHGPWIPIDSSIFERVKSLNLNRILLSPNRSQISDKDVKFLMNLYSKEIEYVDSEIGKLVNKIQELGISLKNTYFIITADHGEQFKEHGTIGHGYLYDEVIRVPLIIAGPGINTVVVNEQVPLLDLSPTILDLVNIKKSPTFQGGSLNNVLNGNKTMEKAAISEGNSFLHGEVTAHRYSYRTQKWKYILLLDEKNNIIEEELYNLKEDPLEKNDLANINSDLRNKFYNNIMTHVQKVNCTKRE